MTTTIYLIGFLYMMAGGYLLHRLIMRFNPLVCLLVIIVFGSVFVASFIGLITIGAMTVAPYTPILVMLDLLSGVITGLLAHSYTESRKPSKK